jgi:hypothetical protein
MGPVKRKHPKVWLELAKAAIIPVAYLGLVMLERTGAIDQWRRIDVVQTVSNNFSLSYTPEASTPAYPGDVSWEPLIELIRKYSNKPLRTDKQPQTVARFVATLSTKEPAGGEWTSPSTPIAVLYKHWPEPGSSFPPDEYTIVGTIGDLQGWIAQSKSDFHFLLHDVVLGILALVVGYSIWHINHL